MKSLNNSSYYEKELERAEKIKARVEKWSLAIKEARKNKAYIEKLTSELKSKIEIVRKNRDISRTWIHVDMDMFYAAVAILDDPTLYNINIKIIKVDKCDNKYFFTVP